MTIAQELIPPDYRNLVINPSGESAISATWFGSNGTVTTGSTAVTPVAGSGVVQYTVTGESALPYYFAPFGPNDTVHHSAFKTPESQTVSARVQLRSSVDVWVELQARFYVWDGIALSPIATKSISPTATVTLDPGDSGGALDPADEDVFVTGASTGAVDTTDSAVFITAVAAGILDSTDTTVFITYSDPTVYVTSTSDGVLSSTDSEVFVTGVAVEVSDSAVVVFDTSGTIEPGGEVQSNSTKLIGGATWQTFVGYGTAVSGSTHWSLLITVAGSDPAGVLDSVAPIGTKVYADRAMIVDSGANVSSVPYFDGTTASHYWEGAPHYSTSRTGTLPSTDIPDTSPDGGTDTPVSGGESPTDGVESNPPPPDVPKIVYVYEPTSADIAADILAWRYTPERLCIKSDIQLANLRLNSIDEDGVLWIVSDIEGWWTLPEPDVPDMPRGWFDGSYETRGRYTARVFTVTGSFIPTSPSSVPAARARLTRAANLCHRGDWFMTHEDATAARTDTKGSKVWLSGQPQIQTMNAQGRTDFSIGLRAPDPIKYRLKGGIPPGYEKLSMITLDDVQYPGRVVPRRYPWAYPESIFGVTDATAYNFGDTIVWPTLILKGPTRGAVRITNADTGQVLRVIRRLSSSEELTINCFTKEVTLNSVGNFRFYLDIDVDWLMIQPGPNRLFFQEEVSGSDRTQLEVLWRSGFIG